MTRELYYADAIKEALAQEMRQDERVYIYGEDVGAYGGVFGVTMGLLDEFGSMRVRSTPLSEGAILGESVGSALYGLRPVPEIQFGDFITVAMSLVVDLMAPYHYRIGAALPITIRIASGGMLAIGNFHSNCWENWFTQVPGLKIVVPSTAYDAKGLLTTSLRDNNPVLFFEQKKMYRLIKDHVPEESYSIPFGQARIAKEGTDISIISYGNAIMMAEEASRKLAEYGINVEIIDLRTLVPLDKEAIFDSVKKTHRALVLHEARVFAGFGGEIVSLIQEEIFDELAAPVMRIGSIRTPVPMHPNLEEGYLPKVDDIISACKKLMTY